MFTCINISKAYDKRIIFKNFSYRFPTTGFVLLLGKSGCGKSTLLNMLLGIISPDSGEITYNEKNIHTDLKWNDMVQDVAYISQTTYFLDYMSVWDNLKLVCKDEKTIFEILEQFNLEKLAQQEIRYCSGGEKQRIAIIRALLSNKKIILLDEPTAALDYDNKIKVFEMLKSLKDSLLIICASHDEQAKSYCDRILDFNQLNKYDNHKPLDKYDNHEPFNQIESAPGDSTVLHNENKSPYRPDLLPYVKKWYSSSMRNKKSGIMTGFVIILMLCALCICTVPETKIDSCLQHFYNCNQLKIWCNQPADDQILDILDTSEEIIDYALIYRLSVNDTVSAEGDGANDTTYDLTANTLPYNENAFLLSDRILYGHYYTDINQVILSYNKALKYGEPESLVGRTITIDLYGGSYNMEIVGIFDNFNTTEEVYLYCGGVNLEEEMNKETIFLNSKFTAEYLEDDTFYLHGQRVFVVYFDSYKQMKSFYQKYKSEFTGIYMSYTDVPAYLTSIFYLLDMILIPIVLFLIPITILFYQQSQKLELLYNKQIFASYEYLGYSKKEIRRCFFRCNFQEMVIRFTKCCIIAFIIMIIFNQINKKIRLFAFELFTFQPLLIIGYFLLLMICCLYFANRFLKQIGLEGWYTSVTAYEDLL